jgi:signal transduction histidine kinase
VNATPTGRPPDGGQAGAYPGQVPGLRAWLRRHPWQADVLLAAALFAGTSHQARVTAVSVLLAATVIPRRRYPEAAFAVAAAIGGVQIVLGLQPAGGPAHPALEPCVADLAIAVLLYTLAAHRSRRVSVSGLVICLLLSGVAIARWSPANTAHPQDAVFAAAIALGGAALTAWVLGDSIAYRYRRAYYASLEDRAARLEAERDAQARIAAAAERARRLEEQRASAVDESAARLRRIERDLHDGAQVRLTALAMTLGEIKEGLDDAAGGAGDGDAGDGGRTRFLVGAAHRNAKETLAELRDLARGIHPPVLDRGLGAALAALAETSAIPATLSVSVGDRPSPAIEAIAYFCAAELLANAAKHSGAGHVAIGVSDQDGGLLMTVADDGAGGARLVPAGGLAGLLERVQTVDGQLRVDSPPGGPTVVTIMLPEHA